MFKLQGFGGHESLLSGNILVVIDVLWGKDCWKSQMPLTGVRVGIPDAIDLHILAYTKQLSFLVGDIHFVPLVHYPVHFIFLFCILEGSWSCFMQYLCANFILMHQSAQTHIMGAQIHVCFFIELCLGYKYSCRAATRPQRTCTITK